MQGTRTGVEMINTLTVHRLSAALSQPVILRAMCMCHKLVMHDRGAEARLCLCTKSNFAQVACDAGLCLQKHKNNVVGLRHRTGALGRNKQ